MRIERLELDNFVSYERLVLDLPPEGSIVFVGSNGAGKSTILDAILFALFRVNTRGRRLDALIRKGARQARVALVFSVDGRKYRVERRLSASKVRQEVGDSLHEYLDGTWRLVARGREVTRLVSAILGVDEKLFTTAVYARQGEIAALLDMQPAERKRLLASLLGLSELERAYERMKDVINYFRQEAARLEGIAEQKADMEAQLREAEEELRARKERAVKLERELLVLKEERREVQERLKRLEELRARDRELRERLTAVRARLREVTAALERAERELAESLQAEKEVRILEEKVAELKLVRDYANALRELESVEGALSLIEERLRRAEELRAIASRREELERLLDEKRRELCCVREALEKAKMEVWQAQRARTELVAVTRELELAAKEAEEALTRLPSRLRVGEPDKLREVLARERSRLEDSLKSLEDEERKLSSLLSVLRHKSAELMESVKTLSEARGSCPLCGAELSADKKEALIAKYRRELEELKSEIAEAEARLRLVAEKRQTLRRELETLLAFDVNAYESLAKRVAELRRKAEELRKTAEAEDARVAEARRLDEEARRVEALVKELEGRLREVVNAERELRGIDVTELQSRKLELAKRLKALREQVSALEGKVSKFGSLEAAMRELEEAERRLSELRGVAALKHRRELEVKELRAQLGKLRREEEKVLGELGSLGFNEEDYVRLRDEETRLARKVGALEGELRNLILTIEDVKKRIKFLRERYEKALEAERRLAKLRKIVKDLELIRRVYSKDGAQRLIREKARPLIERYLRDLVARFNLDILSLKLTEDFNVIIVDAGGERDIASASGGEKAAIGLALRLALAKAVGGHRLGFMMLDEPTQNLDEERRRGLIRALRALFGREGAVFPQLLVVTHNHELEDAADQVFLVEKVGGRSRVKPIER